MVKSTHKTIWYTIKKFTIGDDLIGKEEADDKFLTVTGEKQIGINSLTQRKTLKNGYC